MKTILVAFTLVLVACAPAPTTLVSGLVLPQTLAIDATTIYWTARTTVSDPSAVPNGAIMKAPLAGGAAFTLATGQAPQALAIDASSAYWTNFYASGPKGQGAVMKVALVGGEPVVVAAGLKQPTDLVIDGTNVYWIDAEAGTVQRVPLQGGPVVTIAAGQRRAHGLAVDGTSLYWTIYGIEGDGDGAVMKVALAGGAPLTVAAQQLEPAVLNIETGTLVWASITGAVLAVPVAGGTPVTLVPTCHGQVTFNLGLDYSGSGGSTGCDNRALAVDRTHAYWADCGDGTNGKVWSVPLAGGSAVVLASGTCPVGIAVDDTSVYWSEVPGRAVVSTDPSSSLKKVAK